MALQSAKINPFFTNGVMELVKSELLRALNEKLPELQQRDVELAVNCMLEQMTAALEEGERIEIRGFGSFNIRHHAPPCWP